ncbi:MAG: suppressor of fused domain protein [Planctomycetota bacterium]
MGWLKRVFGGGDDPPERHEEEVDPEAAERWYKRKSALLASKLGTEHDTVMHAIVPFEVGGPLDLYYYPQAVPGTAIATKELCEMPRRGPKSRAFDCYELVMFTRAALSLEDAHNESTLFGRAHSTMSRILYAIARYAQQAMLNPGETCEFPSDMEGIGGKCLVFDSYASMRDDDAGRFGLLLLLEVHRSEMEFARREGSQELIERLQAKGLYPYSDLHRPPVA